MGSDASLFAVGDWVEIVCHDGQRFRGVLQLLNLQYAVINGCGFPCEDIRLMERFEAGT